MTKWCDSMQRKESKLKTSSLSDLWSSSRGLRCYERIGTLLDQSDASICFSLVEKRSQACALVVETFLDPAYNPSAPPEAEAPKYRRWLADQLYVCLDDELLDRFLAGQKAAFFPDLVHTDAYLRSLTIQALLVCDEAQQLGKVLKRIFEEACITGDNSYLWEFGATESLTNIVGMEQATSNDSFGVQLVDPVLRMNLASQSHPETPVEQSPSRPNTYEPSSCRETDYPSERIGCYFPRFCFWCSQYSTSCPDFTS
jgi:hypothetical protein